MGEQQVHKLINAFDVNKDGKVEKHEFMKVAQAGFEISLEEEDEPAKAAAEETAAAEPAKEEKSDGEEFKDCVEPAAKRRKVEQSDGPGGFKIDDQVEIVGVTTESGKAFNGKRGKISKWNDEKKRWMVRFPPISIPTA